jgi:hypothetical protein
MMQPLGRSPQSGFLSLVSTSSITQEKFPNPGRNGQSLTLAKKLYQSLLTEPRKSLHLKIAEEIEPRSGNRLAEVAEALAHHFSQTDEASKAFTYLSMAGAKNLSVYSLDEATTHLTAARALLDKNPDCASMISSPTSSSRTCVYWT